MAQSTKWSHVECSGSVYLTTLLPWLTSIVHILSQETDNWPSGLIMVKIHLSEENLFVSILIFFLFHLCSV